MAFQDFIEDGTIPQNPIGGAAAEFQQERPSFAGLVVTDIANNFTQKAGSFLAENFAHGVDVASDAYGLHVPNTQKITADHVNAMAPIGNDGKQTHITDEPMYENVANMIIKDKQRDLVEENASARYSNANGMLPTFLAGAAATLADPASLVAMSYGGAILGATKVLSGLGAVGVDISTTAARTAARVVSGAAGGTASMVPLAAAQYGISQYQGGDYDMHSALNDLAFGAVGGALLHGGFGSVAHETGFLKPDELMRAQTMHTDFQAQASDILRQPATTKAAAMNSTIADIVNGRPADPESVIGRGGQPPDISQIANDRSRQKQDGYSANMTADEIKAARQTILPDGIKVEPKPSQISDAVIDRYKGTVADQLSRAGISNVDDSVVLEIARMTAEEHNPAVPLTKPRTLEEVLSGAPSAKKAFEPTKKEPLEPTLQEKVQSVEVAPRPKPSVNFEAKLPKPLGNAKSGFGSKVGNDRFNSVPQFANDIDKALYTVRDEPGKAKNAKHDQYINFLKSAGLSDADIRKGNADVRKAVQQHATGKNGKVNIPHVFTEGNPLEVVVPAKRTVAPFRTPNAIQMAVQLGGLKDETGDLRAMDAHKFKIPARGRLVRNTGMSLDRFGEILADRGYVKERPTTSEVLEIIRDGLSGKHIYAESDRAKLERAEASKQHMAYEDDLERHAGDMGIDTTGMKPEDIRNELERQSKEAADEHDALDLLDDEEQVMRRAYYPEEQEHAHETIPLSAYEGHESEVGAGHERSEFETGDEGGVQTAEPVDAGVSGRGAEGEGANTGRATSYERVENVAGATEQGVLGGMEQSAKQAMAARGEKLSAKAEQKPANEGLFGSFIGHGDELDFQIANAEKSLDVSHMTDEERQELQDIYAKAKAADDTYAEKLKELANCFNIEGVQ